MAVRIEYEELCRKIDHLAEEVRELQQAVRQLKPATKKESAEAWGNLMKLAEDVSAHWRGPSAVEEIRAQRGRGCGV